MVNAAETGADSPESEVVRVVTWIRDTAQRQRAEGLLTPEEFESAVAERFRVWLESVPIDAKLRDQLAGGRSYAWNIDTDYLIRSHRGGAFALFLRIAKRIVRPFVKLYTDHILNRQAQINLYFFELLRNTAAEQVRMEAEINRLRYRSALEPRDKPSDQG